MNEQRPSSPPLLPGMEQIFLSSYFEDLLTFLARCTQIPPSRKEGGGIHLRSFEEFVDHDGEFQYDLLRLSFEREVDVEKGRRLKIRHAFDVD